MHQIMDAVYVDSGGRVWFGSAGGVNVYLPAAPGVDQSGRTGGPDRPDRSDGGGEWVTGFNRISTGGRLPDNQVYTVLGDSRGRIWFGTAAGAAALSPDSAGYGLGAFEQSRWTTLTRPDAQLAGDAVHAIAEDRRGRLYFGTREGISVLDESQPDPARRWRQIGGLPHPWVQALVVGPDGRLWAGTKGGLAVLDPDRPEAGWQSFKAHPLGRWIGFLWPPLGEGHIVSDDVTSLVFSR
jgi:ligand-binding sensor domain-containing protein